MNFLIFNFHLFITEPYMFLLCCSLLIRSRWRADKSVSFRNIDNSVLPGPCVRNELLAFMEIKSTDSGEEKKSWRSAVGWRKRKGFSHGTWWSGRKTPMESHEKTIRNTTGGSNFSLNSPLIGRRKNKQTTELIASMFERNRFSTLFPIRMWMQLIDERDILSTLMSENFICFKTVKDNKNHFRRGESRSCSQQHGGRILKQT